MPGSRKRSKPNKRKSAHARRPACRALVVIDERPARQRAIAQCKYVLKHFDVVIRNLDLYDRIDNPAFRQWLHATFGRELTDFRRLQEEIRHLENLLERIEDLHFSKGMRYHEACALARDMQEHPENYSQSHHSDARRESEEQNEPDGDDQDDRDDPGASDSAAPTDQELRDLFRQMIGEAAEHAGLDPASDEYRKLFALFRTFMASRTDGDEEPFEDFYEDLFAGSVEEGGAGKDAAAAARLKTVYRSLAKKLHPDNRGGAGAGLDALWYRVQDAYERGDVQELQLLRAGYDVRNAKGLAHLSVSEILAVRADYSEQLRLLRRRHRDLKKDLAWRFTRKSEHEIQQLHDSYGRMIGDESAQAEGHKVYLEAQVRMYSEPPAPRRAGKKARPVPAEQLSLFDS